MKDPGYTKKLCILPFDHRSYFEELLGFAEPLSEEQKSLISEYKKIIYEGYEDSLTKGVSIQDSAILVDDVFGLGILLDAKAKGYTILQSTEISGIDHFEFEHPTDWQEWLEKVNPDFAKVLIRYNVEGDKDLNKKTVSNLKLLSDYCKEKEYKFLIELLVPPTAAQLTTVSQDKSVYDHTMRPSLTSRAITEMRDVGIDPDIWKIEGMYTTESYTLVVEAATKNGRDHVGIITLGRNETDEVVETWIRTGAKVPGVIGFAVGRTVFLDALLTFRSGEFTRQQAIEKVSQKFIHFYKIFNQ